MSLNTSIIVEGDVTINNPIENNHIQRGILIKIISNLDIFPLISPSAIYQYQRTDHDTKNYWTVLRQAHDATDKNKKGQF